MRRLTLLFCVLSAFLIVPIQSRAEHGRDHFGGERFQEIKERLMRSLELNSDQEKALKEFRKKRSDMRDKWMDLKDLRTETSLLLKKADSTEKQILSKVDESNKLMTELNEARVKNLLELKKKLTPTQFKKIMRFTEVMREKMKSRSHGGGGWFGRQNGAGEGKYDDKKKASSPEEDLPDL